MKGKFEEEILDRNALIQIHSEELAKIQVDNYEDVTDEDKLAYWRACKGNIEVAQERLQNTIQWRQSMNLPELLKDPKWLEKEHAMRKVLWYDYLGVDQHGRPMMVERVGRWDVTEVLKEANNRNDEQETAKGIDDNLKADLQESLPTPDKDPFLTLHCMACETSLQMDRRQPKPDDSTTTEHEMMDGIKDTRGQIVIMDLAGLTAWHLDPRLAKAFGRLAACDSQHYPDTLAHIWVVNAPYLFSALITLIQPFLDPDTAGKVHVSSSVPQQLVDCVGADCLPVELGGNRKDVFPYNESAAISDHPR